MAKWFKKEKEPVIVDVYLNGNLHKSFLEKRTIYTKVDGTEWIRRPMQKHLDKVTRVDSGLAVLNVKWTTGKACSLDEFLTRMTGG